MNNLTVMQVFSLRRNIGNEPLPYRVRPIIEIRLIPDTYYYFFEPVPALILNA